MTKEKLPLYLKKRRTFLFLPTSPPRHHSCLTTAICTCSHKADQQRFQTPNPHIKHRTSNSAVPPHRRAPVSLHTENHWEGGQKPSPSCVWQHCLLSSRGLLFPKHKRGWPGLQPKPQSDSQDMSAADNMFLYSDYSEQAGTSQHIGCI